MLVADSLRKATERLAQTSGSPRLDAELLMAHAFGVSRSELLLRHLDHTEPRDFEILLARRTKSEPVAYIVGMQEFYGRDFLVTRDTLIPRPDSETLIDVALKHKPKARRVLDLGTGTGALLLTFAAETGAKGVGIDQSVNAVEVARKNASRLDLDDLIKLHPRDWHSTSWAEGLGQFDLILCNPPYVETDAEIESDVRDFEPPSALFAGPEGLDDYRIVIPQLRNLMGNQAIAVLEIGHQQADSVMAIAKDFGFATELFHDFAHRARVLMLR